ncbi:CHAT domain-containing protein [Egibacter rhizosphaerae]|nr:CHAT domain-containing protein [Egibacter rhizosphaerae]
MTTGGQRTAILADLAAQALDCAREDPEHARDLAGRVLAEAPPDDPASAASRSIAHRALGLAARADHDLDLSLRHFSRAVETAEGAGERVVAARARTSLFGTLAFQGRFEAAFQEAARAAQDVEGVDLARLEFQRATVLVAQGLDLGAALADFNRALPVLRAAGETELVAATLWNRGMLHSYRGDLAVAEADLREAESLHRSSGQPRLAATIQQNLGLVSSQRGDLPAALEWFGKAAAFFDERGEVDPIGLRDRCEALLPARLLAEARASAEQGLARLTRHGYRGYAAETRLLLAHAAILDDDPDTARIEADRAARTFAQQGRPRHRVLASYIAARAAWHQGEHSRGVLGRIRRAADQLEDAGWMAPAQEARLTAGRLALELGHPIIADRELGVAGERRHRGPLEPRVHGWHAEALRRHAAGNRTGARRAIEAGLRLVDAQRDLLGATDLRTHTTVHGAELAQFGLHLALEQQRADRVLMAAERTRAASLATPPTRPPDDERLASALGRLRQTVRDLDRAALAGEGTTDLIQQQTRLEREVADLARQARGTGTGPSGHLSLDALHQRLGDRALVEFVGVGGSLHAVVVVGERATLVPLGSDDPVSRKVVAVRFAARRLTNPRGSEAGRAAAHTAFDHARHELDRLLFDQLRSHVGDRPLVVVPTGSLHALPWGTLPSLDGRPVTVAPSSQLWLRAHESAAAPGTDPPVLAQGPDVPAAADELAAIADHHPNATLRTGADSTAETVLADLDAASLGHLAAHGTFRADNPQFSSLRLADGPLMVYDLERIRQPPPHLVLSACDAGLSDVSAGDELRGLAAALLGLGTRSVIASVIPVGDVETAALMGDVHAELASGREPATALARAQSRTGADGSAPRASGFVCFGAG